MSNGFTATSGTETRDVTRILPTVTKAEAESYADVLRQLVPLLKERGVSTLLTEYVTIHLGDRDKPSARADEYQRPVLSAWLPDAPRSGVAITATCGIYWWGEGRSVSIREPEGAAVAVSERLTDLKPAETS
ncbi:hypothetical protein [Actinomadura atramentaria]|uniref:hypothetical protein n=1 Tax=Actinomadura atramentaria TaxID=1990 RepID=UPI00037E1BEF|nr:hypothetical protein [Actinomadura atramentaria]